MKDFLRFRRTFVCNFTYFNGEVSKFLQLILHLHPLGYKFHVIEAVFIFYIRISLTTKMKMIYKQYTVCKYVKASSRVLFLLT